MIFWVVFNHVPASALTVMHLYTVSSGIDGLQDATDKPTDFVSMAACSGLYVKTRNTVLTHPIPQAELRYRGSHLCAQQHSHVFAPPLFLLKFFVTQQTGICCQKS